MAEPALQAAQAVAAAAAPTMPPEPSALAVAPHVTFVDLAIIVLTATGVIVAAMAVILGVLAFFGWRAIQSAAAERARRAINRYLQSDEFRVNLKTAVASEVAEQLRDTVKVTIEHARNQGQINAGDGKQPFQG
jgi:hypothetical protein